MALTGTQKVTVAEITRETYDTINSLVTDLNSDVETSIIADVTLWNDNRNDVDLEIIAGTGGGTDLRSIRLLNAIRERVRKALGLSLYSPEVEGGSFSVKTTGVF